MKVLYFHKIYVGQVFNPRLSSYKTIILKGENIWPVKVIKTV